MGHKFNPAHADRLLSSERRKRDDPQTVLALLGLDQDQVLVDIGSGPGWFALEAARMVPNGLVYAVDISPEMLDRVQSQATAAGLTNIQAILAEEEDEYPIHSAVADAMLIANVYHEVDPSSNFLGEVRRILKPNGRCLVVEWKNEQTPGGPPLDERLDPRDVVEEFHSAGFLLEDTAQIGPYHYGLKFRRPT